MQGYLNQFTPETAKKIQDIVFKYSEDPGLLSTILASLEISIREVGPKTADPKTFKRGEMHYLFEVEIRRGQKEIRFDYHGCVAEWLAREEMKTWGKGLDKSKLEAQRHRHQRLYSVLACIRSDYHCPNTWEDFKWEFGEESHDSYVMWERWAKQAGELRAIFTPEEIEAFPG